MRLRVSAKHSMGKVAGFPEMFAWEWENGNILTVSNRDVRVTSYSHHLHEYSLSDSHNSMEVILQKWRSSQNAFCDSRGLEILLQQAFVLCVTTRIACHYQNLCFVVHQKTYFKISCWREPANIKIEYSLKTGFYLDESPFLHIRNWAKGNNNLPCIKW